MSKVEEFLNKLGAETKTKTKPEGGVEKTAAEQEALMFKLANQNETIEAATTLGLAAEALTKLAEESKDELIAECAEGLGIASQNLMIGLNKIAAENQAGAIVDMIETPDGLSKIASVLTTIAAEAENEDFTKLAEDVTTINNTLFDELVELAEKDESVAQYLSEFHSEAK